MSRTPLTNEKKSFYKFKNKVDLSNKETFGYFSEVNPLNNELYVYVNDILDSSPSVSITNHNIGYDINDVIKLFWNDRVNPSNVNRFYDESIFGGLNKQYELTEYFEYRGNIFELQERLTSYHRDKVSREQDVKIKYLEWFGPLFLKTEGIARMAKYIFNLSTFANFNIDGKYRLNNVDTVAQFNEYFRITKTGPIGDIEMYVTAHSNSIRPSRVYYKKVETEIATNTYEVKFIFPLYIETNMSVLSAITGISVLRGLIPTSIKRSSI